MEKQKKRTFKNNMYMLSLIWRVSPARVILTFVIQLLGFASWTFYTVVFMRYLFGDASNPRSFGEAALFIWIVAGVSVAQTVLESWYYSYYIPKTDIKIHRELNLMLFKKADSMDISCWEDPDFYDKYTKATTEAFERSLSTVTALSAFISSALSSLYVIITMCQITRFSLIFITFPLIGELVFGRRVRKVIFDQSQAQVPYRRRYDYVNRTVYMRKYSEEIRLSGIFAVLETVYHEAYDGIKATIKAFGGKRFRNDVANSLLSYPLAFQGMWLTGAILVMIFGTMQIGEFVVLSSAVVSTTHMLNSFTVSINDIFQNGMFCENLRSFFAFKSGIDEHGDGIIPDSAANTLELRHVSFKYRGSDTYAVRDVSLTLRRGGKYALVGQNGSGKSTLIKLIMRLYDPCEGEILYNGINIKEYKLDDYRRLIGITLQDFAVFSATVLENAAMGSVGDNERERLEALLGETGAAEKVRTLEKSFDTTLTREFDDSGAVLSGGEYQKIAITRAFAHDAPIVILDEPSSALDPVAESKMYEALDRLCTGGARIALIISHRLSSAVTADNIFVMRAASLCESGTHRELCDAGGVYAEMFARQSENYAEGEAL